MYVFLRLSFDPTIVELKCDFTDMGKGDFKSKRGKIRRGSNGNTRPKPAKIRAAKKKAQ